MRYIKGSESISGVTTGKFLLSKKSTTKMIENSGRKPTGGLSSTKMNVMQLYKRKTLNAFRLWIPELSNIRSPKRPRKTGHI